MRENPDAVVVGSGPNGLAAAVTLARAGRSVLVVEGKDTVGGSSRTAELTLPGFLHDVGAAVHPLGIAAPFFRMAPFDQYGLEWINHHIPVAHPLDDGSAVLLHRSVEETAATLGRDASRYRKLVGPLVGLWDRLAADLLGPPGIPRHPTAFARFALYAARSVKGLAEGLFRDERARALFAGMGCHSAMPLDRPGSSAVGLVMCITGHALGWPIARGGSQRIVEAMARYLRSLEGEIVTNFHVDSHSLPQARALFLDVTPRQVPGIVAQLPARYRRRLETFRHGPGVFKVDWALDAPIPWRAAECARAGTLHLGGTLEEIASAERAVWERGYAERPFVLLAQQSLFDATRAPEGKHTAWAYCHVPNGSTFDMTDRIEAQVERFAPGFRDRILGRNVMSPIDLELYNPNCVGGDILGGAQSLWRLALSALGRCPYTTPARGVYICSSSTPPGPGVHGMCGYHAANAALRRDLKPASA